MSQDPGPSVVASSTWLRCQLVVFAARTRTLRNEVSHGTDGRCAQLGAVGRPEDEAFDDRNNPDSDSLRFNLQKGFPCERESRNVTKWAYHAVAGVAGLDSAGACQGLDIAYSGVTLVRAELMSRRNVEYLAIVNLGEEGLKAAMLTLFSYDGRRLKEEYRSHGIWGSDYDHPWIVSFERLFVNEDVRRKGLGRNLFARTTDELLKQVRQAAKPMLVITMASPPEKELQDKTVGLSSTEKRQLQRDSIRTTRLFWRSLGFVRVGHGLSFGWARDISPDTRQRLPAREADLDNDAAIDERMGYLDLLVGLR